MNETEAKNRVSWQTWKSEAPQFLNKLLAFSSEVGIEVEALQLDHICLRLKDKQDVEKLKVDLVNFAKKLSEVAVNGRPIMIYKLDKPLQIEGFEIPCIELPFPAQDHDYPSDGWEHAEFVLRGEENIEKVFQDRFPKYSGNYNITTPQVEGEQLQNTTLVIKNPSNRMLAIKFHNHSIEEVVASST
ncbi:MAG TPA: VOC family protein [Patescibacteria group bacterium]|nr:VOC family protein [Patescibacteria group bacterium]